jgi:hypothetical protein
MSAEQRREFHEAVLDADTFEDLPGKWQAAILKAEQNRPNLRIVRGDQFRGSSSHPRASQGRAAPPFDGKYSAQRNLDLCKQAEAIAARRVRPLAASLLPGLEGGMGSSVASGMGSPRRTPCGIPIWSLRWEIWRPTTASPGREALCDGRPGARKRQSHNVKE